MNSMAIWAVVFLAIALVLLFVEIFVPSMGLIAFAAAACAIIGVVLMFGVDTTYGLISATLCAVAVPVMFIVASKIAPNTPIVRFLTLKESQSRMTKVDEQPGGRSDPIVGQTGKALTDLRPVGTCLINGQRIECLAEGSLIRTGSTIRVVSHDGMHIKVRVDDAL